MFEFGGGVVGARFSVKFVCGENWLLSDLVYVLCRHFRCKILDINLDGINIVSCSPAQF